MRHLTFIKLLTLLVSLAGLCVEARADDPTVSESELKAAFLYNFTRFIEWPAEAFKAESDPLQVTVFDDEDFAKTLTQLLADKKAHNRHFLVKNITSAKDAKGSHILFVPKERTKQMPQVMDILGELPVLTIGESPQFLNQGGIINMSFQDNQLRFEIHASAAEKAKLAISSRLMRLATNVRKSGKK
jgi:hypothetical protein